MWRLHLDGEGGNATEKKSISGVIGEKILHFWVSFSNSRALKAKANSISTNQAAKASEIRKNF